MSKRDQYLSYLTKVPLFSAVGKKQLQTLGRIAEHLTFPDGEVIVREGSIGHEFFVIVDGKARVSRSGRDVAQLGPGDFFGELALLDRQPRNATVTADGPLELVILEQRAFAAMLDEVPGMGRKMLIGLARRVHELDGKV